MSDDCISIETVLSLYRFHSQSYIIPGSIAEPLSYVARGVAMLVGSGEDLENDAAPLRTQRDQIKGVVL